MPRKKQPSTLDSPSPHDPAVSYDRAGTAVNGSVAVLAGVGNDIGETLLHSGTSQAVIGTLADFEDSHGRTLAERSPADWAQGRAEELEADQGPERAPKNLRGLDGYEIDQFGCWIWQGQFKGRWRSPMFSLRSARRLVYLRDRGLTEDQAPAGFIHAACGERRCVNPDHSIWRNGSRLPTSLLRPEIRAGA